MTTSEPPRHAQVTVPAVSGVEKVIEFEGGGGRPIVVLPQGQFSGGLPQSLINALSQAGQLIISSPGAPSQQIVLSQSPQVERVVVQPQPQHQPENQQVRIKPQTFQVQGPSPIAGITISIYI